MKLGLYGINLGVCVDPEAAAGVWRCRMCGYVHFGEEVPEECPYFFFPDTAFKKIEPDMEKLFWRSRYAK